MQGVLASGAEKDELEQTQDLPSLPVKWTRLNKMTVHNTGKLTPNCSYHWKQSVRYSRSYKAVCLSMSSLKLCLRKSIQAEGYRMAGRQDSGNA